MEQAGDAIMSFGTAPIQDSLIGSIIAEKYQVERLVGRGGMGAVYEGKHLLLERSVAIKVMQGEMAEDERTAARFLREAKAAARLEHPNAVTIHDFGVLNGNIAYIVMEFIRGCSLRDWLNQHGQCEPVRTVQWLSQTCEAVAAAHQQGIIHRDLKPENIMLKETSGEPVVKVVDFGLAKMVSGDGNNNSRITRTSEVIGTPYYMAPEFYQGEEVDKRADIYALGIIAYEMLKGNAPFTGTIEAIIGGHLFKEPAPLHHTNSKIPKTISDVVSRALSKDRDERFETAWQFAEALRMAISSTDIPNLSQTTPSSTDSKQDPFLQQQRKETAPTLVSVDALEVARKESAHLLNRDKTRETVPTLKSFDSDEIKESQPTLLYRIEPTLLPTVKAFLKRSAGSGSNYSGKRLFLTMFLLLFVFTGLGAGTAFWLGSGSPGQAVPQPVTTIETATPKPVVVIQEKSEQDVVKDGVEESQAEKDSQATADSTKQKREQQFQSQKSVSSAAHRSSKLPAEPTIEPIDEVKKKKKSLLGRVTGKVTGTVTGIFKRDGGEENHKDTKDTKKN
jgi:serine/threonine protein kinase